MACCGEHLQALRLQARADHVHEFIADAYALIVRQHNGATNAASVLDYRIRKRQNCRQHRWLLINQTDLNLGSSVQIAAQIAMLSEIVPRLILRPNDLNVD